MRKIRIHSVASSWSAVIQSVFLLATEQSVHTLLGDGWRAKKSRIAEPVVQWRIVGRRERIALFGTRATEIHKFQFLRSVSEQWTFSVSSETRKISFSVASHRTPLYIVAILWLPSVVGWLPCLDAINYILCGWWAVSCVVLRVCK